jgi:hypothetical protein
VLHGGRNTLPTLRRSLGDGGAGDRTVQPAQSVPAPGIAPLRAPNAETPSAGD